MRNDWLALRKSKRAAVTATAISGIAREAEKAGCSLEEALAMSCARGWTGFKAEWMTRDAPVGAISQHGAQTMRNAMAFKERLIAKERAIEND